MTKLNELLSRFNKIANNPKHQLDSYLSNDKKVVLCTPMYVPEELVHALGMVPMGAWGADVKLEESKKYFPTFICSVMQSIVELGVLGRYEGVSAIMIPSLCDAMQAMGENWKYAAPNIPIISCDLPQNRKIKAGFEFVLASNKRHIKELERISGNKFELNNLKITNEIYNEHNRLMREVSEELSKHPSIKPSQRSDIFKSALFTLKEEHSVLLKQLLIELKNLDDKDDEHAVVRIVTTGIQMDMPGVLEIFDKSNIHIVADDIAQETRQYITDAVNRENSLESLSQKFCDRDYCSLLHDLKKKRLYKLIDTVKEKNAQGIIYLQTKFCDPEEFDYVPMKELCEKHDVKLLMVEVDRQMEQFEQVNTAIQTFVEMLNA